MFTVVMMLLASASLGARGSDDLETLLTSPTRHVRALSPVLRPLVKLGVLGSPTFARILGDLNRTDVIVQIVATQNLRPSIAAQVLLVPHPRTIRFVRINIRAEGADDDLAALIAHELHHALEIAASPDVRDDRALARLYQRIGVGEGQEDEYETMEARETGRQVLRELAGHAAERQLRGLIPVAAR
jgi:hypothetical protein